MFDSERKPSTAGVKARRREVERCLMECGVQTRRRRLFRGSGGETPGPSPVHRLRTALERIGPVFSAFGRYLASRVDLLPLQDCLVLAAIPDHAAALPSATVNRIMTQAVGGPSETVFLSFDLEPVESRFLVQTHHGRVLDGTPVTVKITRTSIQEQIDCDTQCLSSIRSAPPIAAWSEEVFDVVKSDFVRILHHGMDRDDEAAALQSLTEEAPSFDGLQAPRVYGDHSTTDMLTVERLPGWPLGSLRSAPREDRPSQTADTRPTGDDPGTDPASVARRLCCIWLHQALYGHQYPVDLTPDDVVALSTDQLAFTGGVFATLPSAARENLWNYLIAAATPNPDRAYEFLIREMEEADQARGDTGLRNRFRQVVPFRDGAWAPIGDGDTLSEHLFVHWRLTREYGYHPRLHLLDFYRGLATVAFIARSLAPEQDSLREGLDELRLRLGFARMREVSDPALWQDMISHYTASFIELPQRLNEVLVRASRGELPGLPGDQPSRPSREKNTSPVIVALLCLLGAVVLLSHHFAASMENSVWIEHIGTCLFGLLSLMIIRAIRRG